MTLYSLPRYFPTVSFAEEHRMNVFDTEHPLNVPRLRGDSRMRRWLLRLRSVLIVALILFPCLAIFFLCLDAGSEVETTGDDMPPISELAAGLGIVSLTLSIIITSLYSLVSWFLRRLKN